MSHLASFLRLDRVTPPFEHISHIWTSLRQIDRDYITAFVRDVPMLSTRRVDWNFLGAAMTFWDPTHAVFNIQGTELMPTIEEYRTLIGRIAVAQGIVEPNLRTTRLVLVSHLLKVHRSQLHAKLAYFGGTKIVTTKLLCFIESRAPNRIDAALASVVLQVVGGRGYKVALVAETIWSLDCVTRTADRRSYPHGALRSRSYLTFPNTLLGMNRISRLWKRTTSVSTGGIRQHMKISSALHNLRVVHHMRHPQLREGPSKRNSLASGPRGTAFAGKSPRKMRNSSISASFKGSSPKQALSYRDAIRSWHVRTLLWRGPGRELVEVPTHLRIDTSTRLSLGIGAFRGNGHLRPECDGRST
ncbi:hypothetical protein CRG98_005870 [Punica granatum]|uniref:Uncharacterized protein n=1 Tax=Punica granatum TaxID=22663 RepID=A0A2I0KZI3_PUNGR|nr:hypothetical protein CRG98_005870 [Punica granatum]